MHFIYIFMYMFGFGIKNADVFVTRIRKIYDFSYFVFARSAATWQSIYLVFAFWIASAFRKLKKRTFSVRDCSTCVAVLLESLEQTLASVQRSYQQDEPRLVGEVRKARFFCNAKKYAHIFIIFLCFIILSINRYFCEVKVCV